MTMEQKPLSPVSVPTASPGSSIGPPDCCRTRYVIARRVERAKQLLQTGSDFSQTEVAAHAGFSDQSQFSHHFKRMVGVTPGQFRTPAKIA
jgi:AraC-like DNA-binding protein